MSTAARMTPVTSTPTIPVLVARIAELRRDVTSATVRGDNALKHLKLVVAAPRIVNVLPGPDREFDRIVHLSNGAVLEHRWRDERWQYVHGAPVPGTPAAIAADALADEATGVYAEMAVVGDAMPMGLVARLEAQL